MKRIFYSMAVLVVVAAGTALTGCSEKEDAALDVSSENILLFEDLEMLENVSTNPLDNHAYRIELLGNNESLEWFLSRLEDQGVDLSRFNIYGVKKHYMNHTEVLMYSLPRLDSDDMLIAYAYDDLLQVVLTKSETRENGDQRYRLRTPDGRLFYGLTVNRAGEVGEFVKGQNAEMDQFSSQVARLYDGHGFGGRTMMKTKELDEGCCRQMESWSACVDCTLEYFAGKWYGIVAFAVIGPEFTASIGISCIGAQPGAEC